MLDDSSNFHDAHFIVVLEQQQRLDPQRVVPVLVQAGVHRADALRMCKRQRGIALSRLDEERASEIAFELTRAGVDATAMPDDEFPELDRARIMSRLLPDDDGLWLPTRDVTGKEDALVAWDSVQCVVAGLIPSPEQHSLAKLDHVLLSGATTHDDHELFARKSFEEPDPFPLRRYLDTDPAEMVNLEGLRKTTLGKPSRAKQRLRRFDAPQERERFATEHPGLKGIVLIKTQDALYGLHGHDAIFDASDPQSSGHWLRGFVRLVHLIVENALGARVPEATRMLADAQDAYHYLYYDEQAMLEHARWESARVE